MSYVIMYVHDMTKWRL